MAVGRDKQCENALRATAARAAAKSSPVKKRRPGRPKLKPGRSGRRRVGRVVTPRLQHVEIAFAAGRDAFLAERQRDEAVPAERLIELYRQRERPPPLSHVPPPNRGAP